MGSKRAKSNRARFFAKRYAKAVQPEAPDEIRTIDPRASRDEAWRFLEMNPLDFLRNQIRTVEPIPSFPNRLRAPEQQ